MTDEPLTNEKMRRQFVHAAPGFKGKTYEEAGVVFDQWLAAVERAAAVKALRPVVVLVGPIIARIDGERVATHAVNCYEYHVQCLALAVQRRIESGGQA